MKETSPELADAADVLSDQLRAHLRQLAEFLAPHTARLEAKFLKRLRERGFDAKILAALKALTPGSAAAMLTGGKSPGRFIEQIEYHGRRLAKLNLPPSSIAEALQEYDRLLKPLLAKLPPAAAANFQWVREQLQFCVLLTLNNAYYQVREAETTAFYELFRVELESRNLDQLLSRFLEVLAQFSHADAAHLYVLSDDRQHWTLKARAASTEDSLTPVAQIPNTPALLKRLASASHVTSGKKSRVILEPAWNGRFLSCWSVPLAAGGRIAGVMQFGFSKAYEWLPREQDLLAAAAERCQMAAEKARLMENLAAREDQIRQLAEHMLHVEEVERRRISCELHDEAGQSLLCIRLQLEMLEKALPAQDQQWIEKLREARGMTERTILEMRRLIAALSPAVLEQLGLAAAVRQLINRFRSLHPTRVSLSLGRLDSLPQQTEVILYRLVQECCNNIGKHSAATTVNISLSSSDGRVSLIVEDNGIGFDVDEAFAKRESFGLSGMRERVALLGGLFEVVSHPRRGKGSRVTSRRHARGTRISIVLPVAKDHVAAREKSARSTQTRAAIVRAARRLKAVAV